MSKCAEYNCKNEVTIKTQCDDCLNKLRPTEDQALACQQHIEAFAKMQGINVNDMSSEILDKLAKEFYGI